MLIDSSAARKQRSAQWGEILEVFNGAGREERLSRVRLRKRCGWCVSSLGAAYSEIVLSLEPGTVAQACYSQAMCSSGHQVVGSPEIQGEMSFVTQLSRKVTELRARLIQHQGRSDGPIIFEMHSSVRLNSDIFVNNCNSICVTDDALSD